MIWASSRLSHCANPLTALLIHGGVSSGRLPPPGLDRRAQQRKRPRRVDHPYATTDAAADPESRPQAVDEFRARLPVLPQRRLP